MTDLSARDEVDDWDEDLDLSLLRGGSEGVKDTLDRATR